MGYVAHACQVATSYEEYKEHRAWVKIDPAYETLKVYKLFALNTRKTTVSIERIAKIRGLSKQSINKHRNKLRRQGLIETRQRQYDTGVTYITEWYTPENIRSFFRESTSAYYVTTNRPVNSNNTIISHYVPDNSIITYSFFDEISLSDSPGGLSINPLRYAQWIPGTKTVPESKLLWIDLTNPGEENTSLQVNELGLGQTRIVCELLHKQKGDKVPIVRRRKVRKDLEIYEEILEFFGRTHVTGTERKRFMALGKQARENNITASDIKFAKQFWRNNYWAGKNGTQPETNSHFFKMIDFSHIAKTDIKEVVRGI